MTDVTGKGKCQHTHTNVHGSHMKVLLADDSGTMRRIIRNALVAIGINDVVEAEDGLDAWERFQIDEYGLVITDWVMPELSGLQLVHAIRRVSSVPILMVTTVANRHDVMAALRAGVSNYVVKPMRPETLHEKITAMFPQGIK